MATIPVFTIGDRLQKSREEADITVEQMATHLGVSKSSVSNYERDVTELRPSKLNEWADATGVPVWWLLGVAVPTVSDDADGLGIKTPWDWETPAPLPLVHPAQGHLALSTAA